MDKRNNKKLMDMLGLEKRLDNTCRIQNQNRLNGLDLLWTEMTRVCSKNSLEL